MVGLQILRVLRYAFHRVNTIKHTNNADNTDDIRDTAIDVKIGCFINHSRINTLSHPPFSVIVAFCNIFEIVTKLFDKT
nr:MAG TPA: hypothetical protein [Caudoviricetes sp.]